MAGNRTAPPDGRRARTLAVILVMLLVLLAAFMVHLWFAATALQTGAKGTIEFLPGRDHH